MIVPGSDRLSAARVRAGGFDDRPVGAPEHVLGRERQQPLDDAPRGYQLFKDKTDGNIRSVFLPHG